MNETLNGKWSYRSFHQASITVKDDQVQGRPELAMPWSPPGDFEVETSQSGEVTGTLNFGDVLSLKVRGQIAPATDKSPASVEMTAEGHSSVNRLKGYFIPGSDCIVGTILCELNDPGKYPNGTLGPFVLFPTQAKGD